MSARFAELMAISAQQTKDSVAATKQILEEKRKKDEQRKKEQLEREKRDRELQARLLKQRMEEEQRAEERRRKAEEDRHRKEQIIQQREEQQRRNLVYGRDRRSGWSSGGGGGGRGRKSRAGSDEEDGTTMVLTREEKRQRRLYADLNKSFPSSRKGFASPSSQNTRKLSRPVNAGDISESSFPRPMEPRNAQHLAGGNSVDTASNILSVRKQLAAMPPTLMRLGTSKRDVRTIEEIQSDLHKKKGAKIIEGEEARKNGDWFGERKKKAVSVQSLSPSPEGSQSPRARSKDRTVMSKFSSANISRAAAPSSHSQEKREPRTKITVIKPEAKGSLSFSKTSKVNSSSLTKAAVSASKPVVHQPSRTSFGTGKLSSFAAKKRAHSDSYSDSDSMASSPPPPKRRIAASSGRNDISSEIWKLFGKDRSKYVQNDVFSDEEDDMEADADAVRREELRSARIAKREDELAAEEERRHEEEKRKKKKKEKERKGY